MQQAPWRDPERRRRAKEEAQQAGAEWREQFVELCSRALLRLQRLEQTTAQGRQGEGGAVPDGEPRWRRQGGEGHAVATEIAPGSIAPGSVKKGSVTDAQLAALIEGMSQVASQPSSVISDSRGLVLDRRRINDDSDSDIDLSDL